MLQKETLYKSAVSAMIQMCFSSRRRLRRPGGATEYNFYENIEEIKVCADFKMLEVKVPIIFSGT
jgi:hypothetical protein